MVKQAKASDSILSVQGAVNEYVAAKQAHICVGANEIADKKQLDDHDSSPTPAFDLAHWEQQQAYQRYRLFF